MLLTDPTTRIAVATIVWLLMMALTARATLLSFHRTTGLPIALILSTTLMHVGGLVYLIPGYDNLLNKYLAGWSYSAETVATGLEVSLLAVIGYTIGTLVCNRFTRRSSTRLANDSSRNLRVQSVTLLVFGLFSTFLALSSLGGVFSGSIAIVEAARQFLICGVCGLCIFELQYGSRKRAYSVVGISIVFVLISQMLMDAILGDTVSTVIVILSFAFTVFPRRQYSVVRYTVGICVMLIAWSYASILWLEARPALRAAFWSDNSSEMTVLDRIYIASEVFSGTRLPVFDDVSILENADIRMNHNVTIGKTAEMLDVYPHLYTNGMTLLSSLLGWVPRALWPNKPERGGSRTVSVYTGVTLSDTATFGTGPIFDFLLDFGRSSVLVFSIGFGYLLRRIDIASIRNFNEGRILKANCLFTPGTFMIAPLGQTMFIFNIMIVSFLVAFVLYYSLDKTKMGRGQQGRHTSLSAGRLDQALRNVVGPSDGG